MPTSRTGISVFLNISLVDMKITDLSTNSGDHEIHEHVVVQGSSGKLNSIMDHHAFPTIESFVEKHNRYSNWEAVVESSTTDDESSLQHDGVRGKRKLRRIFRKLPFRPTLRFLYVFLWQREYFGRMARICIFKVACSI